MCEDLWLERNVFEQALIQLGVDPQQVAKLAADVKTDVDARAQAHQAFVGMVKPLEDQGREALIEDLLKGPLPTDKTS